MTVSGFPSPTNANATNSFTVTVKDANGYVATGYVGRVHFTSSDPQAVLPGDYTFTIGSGNDNGVHTFSGTLKTGGTQNITAKDTVTASITGSQNGIMVVSAAPTLTRTSPSYGTTLGGTSIILTGMNFLPGATVQMGGTPATGVNISADGTQITCTSPNHAQGTFDIVVTNPDNQSVMLSSGYTFVPPGFVPSVSPQPRGSVLPGSPPNPLPAVPQPPGSIVPGGPPHPLPGPQ